MAIVVTDNCNGCRFGECVSFCPVECFHFDDKMLYIDPDECIECRACIPACPVSAIYDTDDLPEEKSKWIEINAARAAELPVVTEPLPPLPTADDQRAALGF